MGWKSFVGGFAIAGALGLVGASYVSRAADRLPIAWPPHVFYDDQDDRPESGEVHVRGTLNGDGMSGGTFLNVECRHAAMECRINELSSHNPRIVMLWNDTYAIKSWGRDVIVAESDPPATACNSVRLVIVRSSESAQYVRIPRDAADPEKCRALKREKVTWTIGDQPFE